MILAQNIPLDVLRTMKIIEQAGHLAYLVGGCVRDALIHREPHDWDICTDAMPETIASLFPRTILTGMKHGTVTVLMHQTPIEVTTWRIDANYSDRRRPDFVHFTNNLKEDLSRRDFTINAMAWNPAEGLVDPFNGAADLNNRLVRCVGDPVLRFDEDALRMLRAIRFCSELDFTLDEQTSKAIHQNARHIAFVSKERILQEFRRILLGINPSWLSFLWKSGLSEHVLPIPTPDEKTYAIMKQLRTKQFSEPYFWAALFSYFPNSQPELMIALRTEKRLQGIVSRILYFLPYASNANARNIRFCMSGASEEAEGILQLAKLFNHDPAPVEKATADLPVQPSTTIPSPGYMPIRGQYLSQTHHLKGKSISDMLLLLSLIWCERPELFQNEIPDWLIQEIVNKTSGLPS